MVTGATGSFGESINHQFVAQVALYLPNNASFFITGVELSVDGGQIL